MPGLPSWQDFKGRLHSEAMRFPCKRPPLLFAGRAVGWRLEALVMPLHGGSAIMGHVLHASC